MDIVNYNQQAWDELVQRGNEWTVPVTSEVVHAARSGHWEIVLTPRRAVPRDWFPPLQGIRTLCLAGSGGQQAPILAAAGATVTGISANSNNTTALISTSTLSLTSSATSPT